MRRNHIPARAGQKAAKKAAENSCRWINDLGARPRGHSATDMHFPQLFSPTEQDPGGFFDPNQLALSQFHPVPTSELFERSCRLRSTGGKGASLGRSSASHLTSIGAASLSSVADVLLGRSTYISRQRLCLSTHNTDQEACHRPCRRAAVFGGQCRGDAAVLGA